MKVLERFDLMQHPLTLVICRIVLGVTFIDASIYKIFMPAEFARVVYNYQLMPDPLINMWALILPQAELLTGIFLLLGVMTRGTVTIIIGMLLMFIGAISINLIRGVNFDCGCFAAQSGGGGLYETLARDVVYLLLSIPVFLYRDKWLSVDAWLGRKHVETVMS